MNPHQPPTLQAARALLDEAGLPHADLTEDKLQHFHVVGPATAPQAMIGVELLSSSIGLLRSLVVAPAYRRRGLARQLVAWLEDYARLQELTALYLLTDTAQAFFESKGYRTVVRDQAPGAVRSTQEFTSLCSSNAVVMFKALLAEPEGDGAG